jgi:hypothetical protein
MITKREINACVTNDISLEHIYENLQENECMFKNTNLNVALRQKKFEKKKRHLQREDTQKEDIKNNNTYLDSKIFKWSMVWL